MHIRDVLSDMQVEKLEAEVGMGRISVNGSLNRNADIECGMGSVDITLSGEEKDFNYSLEVGMGQVVIGKNQYNGFAKEKKIQNEALKNISAECGMGSIHILFQK